MITVTSVEAQRRFGELFDRSQREPIEVTRRGRTVAYVISEHDMQALAEVKKRRDDVARWYSEYRARVMSQAGAADLADADVDRLVHELR